MDRCVLLIEVIHCSIQTTSSTAKQKDKRGYHKIVNLVLDKIKQSNFGEHNLILYQDLATLNNVYLEYCKTALETLNEMILILSYRESVSNLFHSFKNIGVDVEKYKLQGLL